MGAPLVGGWMSRCVRNSAKASSVYLEAISTDSVQRVVITEIYLTRPAQPVPAAPGSPYSLWSMNFTDQGMEFTIGAEINGVKYSTGTTLLFIQFPTCPD
ncbi:hypothetical protein B0H11DRAFT_2217316 [Mycena galericulata]|nr:hypothetical protein B0H11DRAFT_2217316 [Mycena galericulata]